MVRLITMLTVAALTFTPACAGETPSPAVLIENVPHVEQRPDFCGEACAAMALQKLGHDWSQDDVFAAAGLDPLLGRGCRTGELRRALGDIGFEVGPVWRYVAADEADAQFEALWGAMQADLARGVPSIVCMRYSAKPDASEHFRLVLGHDATTDEVIYHEPAEADGAYRRMKRATFLELWPLKYAADRWTVIRLRLEPGRIVEPPKHTSRFTAADYAQHIRQLRKKVPAEGFTVVIQEPFVVIGDEAPAVVRRRAERTVGWAVAKLKVEYFKLEPTKIIDIWLFRNAESYEEHCKAIFGVRPHTPFGFYSARERAMIMNIGTGGGTLVHEIVHPFVEANFAACPAWFNEGLGSLYEQSAERDGRIVGLTNWRLAGLQKAIRAGSVPRFKELCATTSHQFYRMDRGTNYAQARYLCYYLQERGLLRDYYRRFSAARKDDPTGYQTLQQVLGADDMAAAQKQWEAWVLKLRFVR